MNHEQEAVSQAQINSLHAIIDAKYDLLIRRVGHLEAYVETLERRLEVSHILESRVPE